MTPRAHVHACDPVGTRDIMDITGASKDTVNGWIKRRSTSGYPLPLWTASGNPLWCRLEIMEWYADFSKGPRNRWRTRTAEPT